MDKKQSNKDLQADNIAQVKDAVNPTAYSANPLNFINLAQLRPFTLEDLYNLRFRCPQNLSLSLPDKVFCVFYGNNAGPYLYKYTLKIIHAEVAGDLYDLQFDWPNIAKEVKYQGSYNGTVSLFWEKYGYYNVPFSYIPTDDKRVCYPLIASGNLFYSRGKSYIIRNQTDKLQIKINVPFIGSIIFSDIKVYGAPKPTFTATVQPGWDMSQDDYMRNPFWHDYWNGGPSIWKETPDSWGAKAIYLSGTRLTRIEGGKEVPVPQWTSRCQLLNTAREYWGKPQELEYPIVFIGDNGNIYDFKILCDLTLSLYSEDKVTITGLDKMPIKDALRSYMKFVSLYY